MGLLDKLKQFRERRKALDEAQRKVAQLFSDLYPEEKGKVILKADEADRFVIWVWYGHTRPPRYKFFYVNKSDLAARVLEDNSKYRPQMWR